MNDLKSCKKYPPRMQAHATRELVEVWGMQADDITDEIVDGYLMGAERALGKVAEALDNCPMFSLPTGSQWTGEFVGENGVRFWVE
jgi:hypothetical protein